MPLPKRFLSKPYDRHIALNIATCQSTPIVFLYNVLSKSNLHGILTSMRNFVPRLHVLIPVLLMTIFSAATFSYGKKPVFGFTHLESSGFDKYDAAIIGQHLRNEINALGVYHVLEFSEISLRLAEQNLPLRCNDVQCVIMTGQILGADFFGIASIDKIGKTIAMSMQVVEVRSGRIILNYSEFYKGSKKKFESTVVPHFARKICGLPDLKK